LKCLGAAQAWGSPNLLTPLAQVKSATAHAQILKWNQRKENINPESYGYSEKGGVLAKGFESLDTERR
jgi:hypothetical protein